MLESVTDLLQAVLNTNSSCEKTVCLLDIL